MQKTLQRVTQIIATRLAIPTAQVTPQAHFSQDLGADNIALIELVGDLEDAFGLSIPDQVAVEVNTAQDAAAYIHSQL